MANITLLGLGSMGSVLARELAKANNNVTAWNRTVSRPGVKVAVEAGATFEPSALAAIAKNDILMINLLNYSVINDVLALLSSDGLAGKTVISLTNGTPGDASDMEAKVRGLGAAAYLDGAIMATPYAVGTPESMVLISGNQDTLSAVSNILAPLGAERYLGSDIGAAARWDNAALVQMYGMLTGMVVGLAILKKGNPNGKIGGSIEGMVPVMQSLVPLLGMVAARWDAEEFAENDGHPMAMLTESVVNIKKTCDEIGVDFGTMEVFLEKVKEAEKVYGPASALAALGPLHLKN